MPVTLIGVHPLLICVVKSLLADMAASGHPMKVNQGVRTVAQQQALYAQGRTTPGKIVTNADGVHVRSNHQPHPDGFGWAVDCCFQGPDPFGEMHPWTLYGTKAQTLGLVWGGGHTHGWHGQDRPHIQLPFTS